MNHFRIFIAKNAILGAKFAKILLRSARNVNKGTYIIKIKTFVYKKIA
jgi:hypothetical protein